MISTIPELEGLGPGQMTEEVPSLGVATLRSGRERGWGVAVAVEELSVSLVVLLELRMTASNS
jgi:hypothetical protein